MAAFTPRLRDQGGMLRYKVAFGCVLVLVMMLVYSRQSGKTNLSANFGGAVTEQPDPFSGISKYSIMLEGVETSLDEVEKYHIVLMYDEIKTGSLCTVESLIRALIKGPTFPRLNYAKTTQVTSTQFDNLLPVVIFVWVTDESQQTEMFDKLRKIISEAKNLERKIYIIPKRIDFDRAIEGTELDDFYHYNLTEETLGAYGQQHKGLAFRLALVLKYGGFYMDADMLVVNDPSTLHDGVARQTGNAFNSAVFKFHKRGNPLVQRFIHNFIKNYDGNRWGKKGPQFITSVINSGCMQDANIERVICKGRTRHEEDVDVADWGRKRFFALPWFSAEQLGKSFNEISLKYKLNFANEKTCIMLHLWNKKSKASEIELCKVGYGAYKHSFIGKVKNDYCPTVTSTIFASRTQRNCQAF